MAKKKNYKYFVKENNKIIVVKRKYFDELKSREEAFNIALQTYLELQNQLREDAIQNDVGYIGTIALTDGLSRSMEEFESLFPTIHEQIKTTDKRYEGIRIASA